MQKYLAMFSLSCALLILPGCSLSPSSTPSTATGTFTPPTAEASNPAPYSAGERRLVTATSTDGIHFTPTGKVFTEQGNVPDSVMTKDGTIFMYYIGQGIEEGKETTAVATSNDQGKTWTYHFLTYKNWKHNRPPSDPDVVLRDDGTFRMYYTDNISASKIGIVYADSPDGYTFTYQGTALSADTNVNDSSTMYFNGAWHMFVLNEKTGEQYHATSTDGATFTLAKPYVVTLPKKNYIISNPIISGDTLRMFGFTLGEMRSFTSTDATTWTASDVTMANTDASTLNSGYLQDMAVQKLSDSTYLMVYVVGYEK